MPRHATQSQSHHMTSSKRKWHHGFNLQLWELDPMTDVCGEGVLLLQRKGTSHCDWPCQVATLVGSAKRRKETVGFSFPLVINQNTLSIFVPHFQLLSPDITNQVIAMKTEKKWLTIKTELGQIIVNTGSKAVSCFSRWCWGWQHLQVKRLMFFIFTKDNP